MGGIDHLDRTISFDRQNEVRNQEMDSMSHSTYDRLYHVKCMARTQYSKYLIHGLLKKPSLTPSLAEDENDEPLLNAELRLAFHIKQLITMKLGTCLKWLGIGIIEVGTGMRSTRP
ncbi:hypothetical protein TNIN_286521 [Trichonephila inaurata madagascariensis]|uniref:Uncharacterized protein n=1 Tax=Trichonephila inaurata madagascariensis TaxID=2747483 RepID=A0A8X7CAF5_9ARAC|nr:hypothetical protein TNIN_286521 [Trichonephila inaurata madagascariensis]